MKICDFKLHLTRVPFNIAFNHNSKSRVEAEAVILEVHTECGAVGYGEALPREYVTGESNQSVLKHAIEIVLPSLVGKDFACFGDLITWLGHFHQYYPQIGQREQCIKALVDLALLDAYGKSVNEPVVELIGGRFKPALKYSGVISSGNPGHVEKYIQAYRSLDIDEYKVKVGGDWQEDIDNILRLRELCGSELKIRVDANEAWDLVTATERLVELGKLGVSSCEQPLSATMRDDYPILRENVAGAIKICIDESLCSLADAYWFVEHRGADIFNLRVSKNGGIMGALALARLAAEANIECQLGSQVGETSLLTRSGQILASCAPRPFIHHEGAFGTMLLEQDLTEQSIMFGRSGLLMARDAALPGLGVQIDNRRFAKMIDRTVWQTSAMAQLLPE